MDKLVAQNPLHFTLLSTSPEFFITMFFRFFAVFLNCISTKGSIYHIYVGVEGSNGTTLKIFRQVFIQRCFRDVNQTFIFPHNIIL